MFDIYKDKDKHVHFIGIGGISMSGLAAILLDRNFSVSGSDRSDSPLLEKLRNMGAKIYIGHAAENVKDADLVVYTAAIPDENPELQEARRLNIPTEDRAEFLGAMMKHFPKAIGVSGTHGKTTTTSMLSLMLLEGGLDPTIMVGGELDAIGGNVRPGSSPYMVAEACEYKASFLKFFPNIGIILNIDADHLDFYKDIDDIYNTFLKFSKNIPEDGLLIGCAEDSRVMDIINKASCKTLTYGISKGDFTADNISYDSFGHPSFEALHQGKPLGNIQLSVPGEHNVLNALACIACSFYLGLSFKVMASSLHSYTGTHRRFEKKGEVNGVTIIDDYAHHPTEMRATIKAALNYPHKRLYCVFQPHTYTRTYTLFKEFTEAFDGLDKLILVDIYAARENDTGLVSSSMLCEAVKKRGVNCQYAKDFDGAVSILKDELKPGDVVITMGAGDVFKIGEMYLQ
jgi:UDP-N-acetylmuramate--alanine ligase